MQKQSPLEKLNGFKFLIASRYSQKIPSDRGYFVICPPKSPFHHINLSFKSIFRVTFELFYLFNSVRSTQHWGPIDSLTSNVQVPFYLQALKRIAAPSNFSFLLIKMKIALISNVKYNFYA